MQLIATFVFAAGIAGLYLLDYERNRPTSKALWIPVMWLLIAGSRNVGEWLHMSVPLDQSDRYIEGNPVDRAVLFSLILLGIMVLMFRLPRTVRYLQTSVPVVLFFAYCGASSLWSDFPDVAFKRWVRALGDIIVVLVILTDPDWEWALKRVLARVGFLLLPISVLLIRFYPALGRVYNAHSGTMYWTGVTDDKNGLGMISLIFGLGAVWRFVQTRSEEKNRQRTQSLIAQGALMLTALYLLLESNSMTSISCFGLTCGLMFAVRWFRFARRPAVATLLAATAIAVSAFVLFSGDAGGVLQKMGRNPTLTGRTEVWSVVLPFAQNAAVGTGYESFWLGERLERIGQLTQGGIQEAHNGYLEIYLNLGWVGIGLLGLIVLAGLRKTIARARHAPHIGSLFLAYFVLALIYNFTEAGFKMMNPVWIFFLLSVMAIASPGPPDAVEAPAIEFEDDSAPVETALQP